MKNVMSVTLFTFSLITAVTGFAFNDGPCAEQVAYWELKPTDYSDEDIKELVSMKIEMMIECNIFKMQTVADIIKQMDIQFPQNIDQIVVAVLKSMHQAQLISPLYNNAEPLKQRWNNSPKKKEPRIAAAPHYEFDRE